jgi:PAS domain S-box-containing protein
MNMNNIAYNLNPAPEPATRRTVRPWRSLTGPNSHTVYVLDRNGVIIESNEVVAPLTGLSPDELAGRKLASCLDPTAAGKLEAVFAQLETATSAPLEAVVLAGDGRSIPVHGRVIAIREDAGGFYGAVVDLERALVWAVPEEDPGPSEADELLDLVSDAVMESDDAGRVLSANRAGRLMFGYPGAEWEAGIELDRLFVSLDARAIAELAHDRDRTPKAIMCARQDGHRFIARIRAQRLRGPGLSGRSRLVVTDLSSHREIERMGRVLEFAAGIGDFCFAILGRDRKVKYADPMFAALFGYDAAEAMSGFPINSCLRERGPESRDPGAENLPSVTRAMIKLPARDNQGRAKKASLIAMGEYQLVIVSAN